MLSEIVIWCSYPNHEHYFEALQMSSGIIHLEYSRCHENHDIWSTPDVVRNLHLEFFSTPTLKHSICHLELFSKPWTLTLKTPDVI